MLRAWASEYSNQHLIGKWSRLGDIRWLIVIWWGVLLISLVGLQQQTVSLGRYYQAPRALPGGSYAEGLVGKVKIINPILPDTQASTDISRLIFNGLTRYNPKRQIEADLATDWQISPDGKTYTFHLRRGVKWHDGQPFTAQDVVFTLVAIQNPDSRSPLSGNWQGVKAEAKDDYTVVYTLPNAYTPFLDSTTVGILPRHLLESIDPSALRSAEFNQHPVGTGPFRLASFSGTAGEADLAANPDYFGGKPLLNSFIFRWYDTTSQLIDAYAKHQIMGLGRVSPGDISRVQRFGTLRLYELNRADQTDLFFKTTSQLLSDKNVRLALERAVNRSELIKQVLHGWGMALTLPILPGQSGYAGKYTPSGYDLTQAEKLLDAAGWTKGQDGKRAKNNQQFKLKLLTLEGSDNARAAQIVASEWKKIGVDISIKTVPLVDLEQSYIRPRNYDVLLYGINIGADPDVYPYWHSSQANDPGLNLSQYSSSKADKALEGGRIVSDPEIRAGKYAGFLAAWSEDNPAVVLYSPDYIYAVNRNVLGVQARRLVDPSDRFYGVEKWAVNSKMAPAH